MANIRESILQAADYIQRNPEAYQFCEIGKPEFCGSPGCLLGYIGWFSESKHKRSWGISREILDIESGDFYSRLDEFGNISWRVNPRMAAEYLCLYADKYHPAKPSKELPSGSDICRAIVSKPFRERVEV